jgi:glycosyltransferase involved in cell wall biosynthesis
MSGPDHAPDYTAAMKKRSEELGISSKVIWAGFSDDVAPRYRAADIYSLPSENEGLPNAMLEAMACGLPSIVTAISGTTDLISEGVEGRLVNPDAEEIAEALASYIKSPATAAKHGRAAREKVVARCSAEVVLDAHERLFRRIMAGGPAAE